MGQAQATTVGCETLTKPVDIFPFFEIQLEEKQRWCINIGDVPSNLPSALLPFAFRFDNGVEKKGSVCRMFAQMMATMMDPENVRTKADSIYKDLIVRLQTPTEQKQTGIVTSQITITAESKIDVEQVTDKNDLRSVTFVRQSSPESSPLQLIVGFLASAKEVMATMATFMNVVNGTESDALLSKYLKMRGVISAEQIRIDTTSACEVPTMDDIKIVPLTNPQSAPADTKKRFKALLTNMQRAIPPKKTMMAAAATGATALAAGLAYKKMKEENETLQKKLTDVGDLLQKDQYSSAKTLLNLPAMTAEDF